MTSRFPVFLILMFATVALPWGILIFNAEEDLATLRPTTSELETYYVDKDGKEFEEPGEGLTEAERIIAGNPQFPKWRGGDALTGRRVYEANGCVHCHTQQVRQPDYGVDSARGWGDRQSVARDYLFDIPVLIGRVRIGPDLANVGTRMDQKALLKHIYRPPAVSSMPSYASLYRVQEVRGDGSPHALEFAQGEYGAPKAGWEVVPKPSANYLVDYLLTLKQDYDLPESRIARGGDGQSGGASGADQFGGNKVLAKGKKLYSTPGACITCHQPNGEGNDAAQFPPLAGSDWVTGSEEILVRVVLHGLSGPIKVKGKDYGAVPMVPTIWASWSDEEIAAVLSYIRFDWGNDASEVSAETVKRIRDEVGSRTTPWTAPELEQFKEE